VDKAFGEIKKGEDLPVPLHLRNAPTELMKSLGYSDNYKYPHDYEGNFVRESYMPEELKNVQFYSPSENGFEKTIKERLVKFWQGLKKY
jgi:putative ATPase